MILKSYTASFDTRNRILTLPMWTNISDDLYDMLVVHEVGHALDSPPEKWIHSITDICMKYHNDKSNTETLSSVRDFLNIIEDVRIEKRQKIRYPGSKRNFVLGYKELYDRDFFGINSKDTNSLSFIDRANIYFKNGTHLNIKFDAAEKVLINKISSTETFDDVINLTDEIYGIYLKKAKEEQITKGVLTTDDVMDIYDQDEDGDENDNRSLMSLVPNKVSGYVPFGHFNDVRSIISSNKFYSVYVTGLSGNGKTMMIEQVCAAEKRELIRVNITIETDEDDLIGGFRLGDGRTVWHNGPVIQAMERGAILLLDEVDLGSNKMMCLQPVLEGNSIFIKKINKRISPMPGFNIIATANTKGKGSDDGRFIGTNVMNESFLERFSITLEQEYPAIKVETKILNNVLKSSGIEDNKFVDLLVQWADIVRKSFMDGAVTEIISTRRLVYICEAFAIFNRNREKAIQLCLNRFDIDTKNSFMELYKKLDETINPLPVTNVVPPLTDEVPF